MKKRVREPWAIDICQRLIALGITRKELAYKIKISEHHVCSCLNGTRVATERTKLQIIKCVEELEKEAAEQ